MSEPTHILITGDGRLVPFNPSDYEYVVSKKELEEGKYDLKCEVTKVEGDTYTLQLSQLVPPLIKFR